MAKDEMGWAFSTCWRKAGDDINAFIGATSDDPVSAEDLRRAGEVMVEYAKVRGDVVFSTGDPVSESIQEAVSQGLEAVWDTQLSKWLKKPEKRAEMMAFIEGRTGRPLPLDPDPITGNERAQTHLEGSDGKGVA